MTPRARWVATAFSLATLALSAWYLRQQNLATPGPKLLPPCSWHYLTKTWCPGCGGTRAAHALLHGDLPGAFRQNPLLILSTPFLIAGACLVWLRWISFGRIRPKIPIPWSYRASMTLVVVLISFWVLRNVPYRPFTYLAPVPVTREY